MRVHFLSVQVGLLPHIPFAYPCSLALSTGKPWAHIHFGPTCISTKPKMSEKLATRRCMSAGYQRHARSWEFFGRVQFAMHMDVFSAISGLALSKQKTGMHAESGRRLLGASQTGAFLQRLQHASVCQMLVSELSDTCANWVDVVLFSCEALSSYFSCSKVCMTQPCQYWKHRTSSTCTSVYVYICILYIH